MGLQKCYCCLVPISYYLRQINGVSGGDTVFVQCVSVCVGFLKKPNPVVFWIYWVLGFIGFLDFFLVERAVGKLVG